MPWGLIMLKQKSILNGGIASRSDRNETVNHIISECNKEVQNVYKTINFPVQNGSSSLQNGNSSFQNGNSSVQNGKIIISINIKNIL